MKKGISASNIDDMILGSLLLVRGSWGRVGTGTCDQRVCGSYRWWSKALSNRNMSTFAVEASRTESKHTLVHAAS